MVTNIQSFTEYLTSLNEVRDLHKKIELLEKYEKRLFWLASSKELIRIIVVQIICIVVLWVSSWMEDWLALWLKMSLVFFVLPFAISSIYNLFVLFSMGTRINEPKINGMPLKLNKNIQMFFENKQRISDAKDRFLHMTLDRKPRCFSIVG